MSEEIEKHVLRKYEICQKLGKGVSKAGCWVSRRPASVSDRMLPCVRSALPYALGLRYCLEGGRQADTQSGGAEEML